jgi:predicted cupin superfamily sugar epimerase
LPQSHDLIRALGLEPHPEGGSFRVHFVSARPVRTPEGAERRALSVIQYLLLPHESSRWHRVVHDEAWFFHAGAPLELSWIDPDFRSLETKRLAASTADGEPAAVVPAGAWQCARPTTDWALVSCAVAPGFDYADWAMMRDVPEAVAKLREKFPDHARFV